MLGIPRIIRNVNYILFKGIQEIGDSNGIIYYKCLKCGAELKGNRQYGKLRILCECGHSANVYTGKNIHFKNDYKKATPIIDPSKGKRDRKEERDRVNEQQRIDVFNKYLNSDLGYICSIISNQHDIRKQVRYEDCMSFFSDYGDEKKEDYEKTTNYLQKHCDLDSTSLRVVWEPLDNQDAISSLERDANILGTTYPLQMKSLIFYTIYLNPKFITSREILIATIAHELSHIYARHNGIHFTPSDNERGINAYNEQMTDLLGIVLGMGDLLCTSSERNESFDTGYLTNEMLCESNSFWQTEYLSIVVCSQCGQKLKVPKTVKKEMRLVCPKCRYAFEYKGF